MASHPDHPPHDFNTDPDHLTLAYETTKPRAGTTHDAHTDIDQLTRVLAVLATTNPETLHPPQA